MELGLAGKTALVTGGSKGIGLETARALAREGVKVLICARRETALAEAARDIMRPRKRRSRRIRSTSPKSSRSKKFRASSAKNSAASTFSSTMPAPAPTSRFST